MSRKISLEEFGAVLENDLLRREGAVPLADEALADVSGGQRILFEGDGLNRHSWFVSLLSRWLANEPGAGANISGDALPRSINVGGTTYQIIRDGENIYVDELG